MDSPPEKEPLTEFLSKASVFNKLNIKIPKIYAQNLVNGFLIIEDFGNLTFLDKLSTNPKQTKELLFEAIDVILKIQTEYQKKQNFCSDTIDIFSENMLSEELNLFREWYVGTHLNLGSNDFSLKNFQNVCSHLISTMVSEPQVLVHRDFHSKNLMYMEQTKSIGVLDFQDAVIGPSTYDLVSLLRDAYIDYDGEVESACLTYFFDGIKQRGNFRIDTFESFKVFYDFTTIQRNLKIIGIFCRLKYRDNKENYMKFLSKLNKRTFLISKQYSQLNFISNFLSEKCR